MRIIFLPEAAFDLEGIRLHIKNDSPQAAAKVSKIIRKRIKQLKDFPEMGPFVRGSQTRRRLIIPRLPYFVLYNTRGESIHILRVFHTARRWPQFL